MKIEDCLEIGKIASPHGMKGELKVIPLTDDPRRFSNLEWVYAEKEGIISKLYFAGIKFHKNHIIVKFMGINDRSDAEGLKGAYLKVDRQHAVKLPEDTYFICDLIGCTVYDEDGDILGKVKNIIETGSNDVYEVENGVGRNLLIPALKSVVKEVSIKERKILVILPEGLIDDEV